MKAIAFILALLLSAGTAGARNRAAVPPGSARIEIVTDGIANYVSALTTTPQGSVVFTGDRIGILRTTGAVEMISNESLWTASLLAVDEHTIWASNTTQLARFTDSGGKTIIPVRVAANIRSLAAGDDGNVWFLESAKDRLGLATKVGQMTEYALPPELASPSAMMRGIDGALEIAVWRGVARMITPDVYETRSAEELFANRNPAVTFVSMAQTGDGTTWLSLPIESTRSGYSASGAIVRMDAAGQFTTAARLPYPWTPVGLATTEDSSIWFIMSNAFDPQLVDRTVLARLRPDGTLQTYAIPHPRWGTTLSAGALCARGNRVWIALNAVSGGAVLARIDAD